MSSSCSLGYICSCWWNLFTYFGDPAPTLCIQGVLTEQKDWARWDVQALNREACIEAADTAHSAACCERVKSHASIVLTIAASVGLFIGGMQVAGLVVLATEHILQALCAGLLAIPVIGILLFAAVVVFEVTNVMAATVLLIVGLWTKIIYPFVINTNRYAVHLEAQGSALDTHLATLLPPAPVSDATADQPGSPPTTA